MITPIPKNMRNTDFEEDKLRYENRQIFKIEKYF